MAPMERTLAAVVPLPRCPVVEIRPKTALLCCEDAQIGPKKTQPFKIQLPKYQGGTMGQQAKK